MTKPISPMEDILKKEIIHFILLFRKFTNKPDFDAFILCQVVSDYLIKERMVYYPPEVGRTAKLCWVSGNFEVLHSYNDQPSTIYKNGTMAWYKYGELHRDNDQPAIIYDNGTMAWYKYGKRNRDNDQPAIIYNDGTKAWYKNGDTHRDNDKPAIIYSGGSQEWHKNGKLYRENGKPSIVYYNGGNPLCMYVNSNN